MKELLLQLSDLEIWSDNGSYYALYDAGSHQIAMRKDSITKEEAILGSSGPNGAKKMLFALQKRLIESGIDPYSSNLP